VQISDQSRGKRKKAKHNFCKERSLEVPKLGIPQPVPPSKGRAKKVLEAVFRIPPELICLSYRGSFVLTQDFSSHWKRSLSEFQEKQLLDM
jgi:hypothetical protein